MKLTHYELPYSAELGEQVGDEERVGTLHEGVSISKQNLRKYKTIVSGYQCSGLPVEDFTPDEYDLCERYYETGKALFRDLTRRQRAVFELFFIDQLSGVEIGEKLNISPQGVSEHLKLIKLKARKLDGKE